MEDTTMFETIDDLTRITGGINWADLLRTERGATGIPENPRPHWPYSPGLPTPPYNPGVPHLPGAPGPRDPRDILIAGGPNGPL